MELIEGEREEQHMGISYKIPIGGGGEEEEEEEEKERRTVSKLTPIPPQKSSISS